MSSEKNRITRVSIVEALMLSAMGIALFISGLILNATGYVFTFTFCVWMYSSSLVYIYTWLDPLTPISSDAQGMTNTKDGVHSENTMRIDTPFDSSHTDKKTIITKDDTDEEDIKHIENRRLLSLNHIKVRFDITYDIKINCIILFIYIYIYVCLLYNNKHL